MIFFSTVTRYPSFVLNSDNVGFILPGRQEA